MRQPITLAVDGLAAYRLTRLAVEDTITDPLRIRASDASPFLADMLECRWCAGVWVGFGVMAVRRLVPGLWAPVAEGLALAAVAGMLESAER